MAQQPCSHQTELLDGGRIVHVQTVLKLLPSFVCLCKWCSRPACHRAVGGMRSQLLARFIRPAPAVFTNQIRAQIQQAACCRERSTDGWKHDGSPREAAQQAARSSALFAGPCCRSCLASRTPCRRAPSCTSECSASVGKTRSPKRKWAGAHSRRSTLLVRESAEDLQQGYRRVMAVPKVPATTRDGDRACGLG